MKRGVVDLRVYTVLSAARTTTLKRFDFYYCLFSAFKILDMTE